MRVEGPFFPLAPIKQSAKWVHAWAVPSDADVAIMTSNTFELEYPPRSGRRQSFPEVDRAQWFDLETAREKILASQRALLEQLERADRDRLLPS